MKLLLDENLSPTLVSTVGDLFVGSQHVASCGLRSTEAIRAFIQDRDEACLVIVRRTQ